MGWSGLTGEERQEALRAGVDDVDLMQGHRVHHLLAFLELPIWALYELGLRSEGGVGSWGGVVKTRAEKSTKGGP